MQDSHGEEVILNLSPWIEFERSRLDQGGRERAPVGTVAGEEVHGGAIPGGSPADTKNGLRAMDWIGDSTERKIRPRRTHLRQS